MKSKQNKYNYRSGFIFHLFCYLIGLTLLYKLTNIWVPVIKMDKRHIHTVNEGHKKHNYDFCGKSFTRQQHKIWRSTSTQFMKATEITSVNLVTNHFLQQSRLYLKKHIETIHEGKKHYKCEIHRLWILWQVIFSSRTFEKPYTTKVTNVNLWQIIFYGQHFEETHEQSMDS